MSPYLFIVHPARTGKAHLHEVDETIARKTPFDTRRWAMNNPYDDKWIENSSGVVVILPENKFSMALSDIPGNAMPSEIKEAMNKNKLIVLAYRLKTTNQVKLYRVDQNLLYKEGIIKGNIQYTPLKKRGVKGKARIEEKADSRVLLLL